MKTKINPENDPSVPAKEYHVLEEKVKLPHALMGGTKTMRDAGKEFLPQETREADADYIKRLNRTFLFNGYGRTVSILTGEVFDKPVTLTDDVPDQFADLTDNIDMTNSNLTRFSWDSFLWGLVNGAGFIFVDIKEKSEANDGTVDADKAEKRRPYWVHIPASRLIDMKFDENMEVTQVRFKETVQENIGEYGTEEIKQIRVLENGWWKTYRQNDKKDEWVLHKEGKSPLQEIPVVPFFFGMKAGKFTADPPMTGLAELNLEHWQSSSDQRNILHVARVPILFGKFLQTDDDGRVIVSVQNLLHSKEPDGDLKFVEHSGSSIGAGWKDLERIEMMMQLWGLDMISDSQSGTVTATERALTGAKTGSFLNACVQEFQDALNTAMDFTCKILKIESKGSIVVNTDFSLALQSFDASVLVAAFKASILDRATVVDEFKRRGLINENADATEIAAALQNDGGMSGGFGAVGNSVFN